MSDNYRALTRTYRPKTFDDIVSQEHVSDTLKNAIKQNRLAHAYMFCGPRGVGKTTMARVLARTVNSIQDDIDGESLNQTLNVIEIDAASNNGVDDIRDLRERVRIPPQNGRYKVYIIDEVHMLSKAAFNALLKTLEEPPDHVIFIFATTEPHKVLPTILSRVQRFDFKRISVDEIVDQLAKVAEQEAIKIDHESLHVIAKKADGALRDALGLMDQAIAFCGSDIQHEELLRALNVVSTERIFQFMQAVEQHDASSGLELISELLQEGYDIQEFLISLTEHLRNLYIARNSAKMHLVEASGDTKKRYQEASDVFSEDDLMRMLHIVSETQYKIKEAHQPRIQFEITLLKLIHMERTQNLDTLLAGLEDLKKKFSSQAITGKKKTEKKRNGIAKTTVSNSSVTTETETPDKINSNGSSQEKKEVKHESVPGPETDAESPREMSTSGEDSVETEEKHQETQPASSAEDDLNNFFGTPSLQSANGHDTSSNNHRNAQDSTKTNVSEPDTVLKSPPQNISLSDVKECWNTYVDTLKQSMPQMLYFQMQRIDPVKLKNRQLTLRCNDDFAQNIINENKRELAKILEKTLGIFLQFNCVVQKTEEDAEESMSPYERFKRLQDRDPKIKTLVELFGAELDYNLNR